MNTTRDLLLLFGVIVLIVWFGYEKYYTWVTRVPESDELDEYHCNFCGGEYRISHTWSPLTFAEGYPGNKPVVISWEYGCSNAWKGNPFRPQGCKLHQKRARYIPDVHGKK